jgi:hypothetical protein
MVSSGLAANLRLYSDTYPCFLSPVLPELLGYLHHAQLLKFPGFFGIAERDVTWSHPLPTPLHFTV